jgi:hypothetical protein
VTALDVLTAAVLLVVAVRVGGVTRRLVVDGTLRARSAAIVRGIRWRHVRPVPFVLTAIVVAASVLITVPGLAWGWWSAIGGIGNPVTGGTERTAGTALEWLVPLVLLTMLLPAVPLFAEAEERLFRLGAESWPTSKRIWKGVQFGLAHALIGVPIGVALALSIGGWYFTWWYLREGIAGSTRAHTAYNGAVLLVLLVALTVDAVI